MTVQITGNDAQFNEKVTLLKDLEIYGNIKNKTKDTLFDFSDNFVVKTNETERLRIDVSGKSKFSNTTEATSSTDASVVFNGGVGINTHSQLADNARLKFGNSGVEIFHDGINGVINNNTGEFFIENDLNSTSEIIHIRAKAGENSINAIANGSVELYHNNAKRLETTSSGVVITGICTATNTAKAYVHFNGTTNTGGNCDIRESYNVTSVTDNGTGDYTIIFTNAMANANYTVVGSTGLAGNSVAWLTLYTHTQGGPPYVLAPTTSSFRITTSYQGVAGNLADPTFVQVVVFGN